VDFRDNSEGISSTVTIGTSNTIPTMGDEKNWTKEEVLAEMDEKKRIESEMVEWTEVLSSEGGVGMHEPLVDAEGYPRNDIDVHKVREGRNKLICLGNDLHEITSRVEQGIHSLHAQSAQSVPKNSLASSVDLAEVSSKDTAFAKIDSVAPGSPADIAGIQIGDQMLSFGSVTHKNFNDDLGNVANVAKHSQNQNVRVQVLRNGQMMTLALKPQAWSGRGIVGCNIVPIKRKDENVDR